MVKQILFYFSTNVSDYLLALQEHIGISLLALLVAMVIGIPFGVLCTRSSRWYGWVTTIFNTFRIVPSLAILILMIPVVGTGIKPTIIALIFLAIPPILINTATGFHSLPFFMIEAAALSKLLAASFSVAGLYQVLVHTTFTVTLGLTDCAPNVKALIPRTTSGIGKAAT